MTKAPKKYECLVCGFKSSRCKTINLPGIGFACCFKCRGRVIERSEWLEWLHAEWAKGKRT